MSPQTISAGRPAAGAVPQLQTPSRGRAILRPRALRLWVLRVATIALIIGSWQFVAVHRMIDINFIGEPTQIWSSFISGFSDGTLMTEARQTLFETAVGFAAGAVAGLLCGLAFSEIPLLGDALQPVITALNSLPRIALAPLFVLWFGIGGLQNIVLAFSLVFFIVLANTSAGLKAAERDHLMLARTLGVKRWSTFRLFVWPNALPTIFAGLELGVVYAFLGTVGGEMLNGSHGLGAGLALAATTFRVNDFFAILLLLVLLSVAISQSLRWIQRRLLRWRLAELRGTRATVL